MIQDPIYGALRPSRLEQLVLESWPLQRLRGIQQLALVDLVYPGAVHTRFEHSLGTMHVAGLMACHLGLDKSDVQLARMAGLLHDIGHSAFSHAIERLLSRNPHLRPNLDGKPASRHEDFTVWTIRQTPFGHDVIDRSLADFGPGFFDSVVDVLSGKRQPTSQIISGDVDADRLDFLLRDSHHTGVSLGLVDLDRIINSLACLDGRIVLLGDDDYSLDLSITSAESLLVSRSHHYNALVHHPKVQSARAMLLQALELLLGRMDETEARSWIMKFFTTFTDSDLITFLASRGDEHVKRTLADLRSGAVLPLTARFDHRTLPPEVRMSLATISRYGRMQRLFEDGLQKKYDALVDLSTGSGVPRSARTAQGFLYDESALAAGLIRSLTRQITLSFFSNDEIDVSLDDISKRADKLLDFIRNESYLQVDGLLLLFFTLHKMLCSTYGEKILVPRLRNITWVYRTVQSLHDLEGRDLAGFYDYNFNEAYGFPYSEKLFEDIQILVAMGMIYQDMRHFEVQGRWSQRYEYMLTAEGLRYAKRISGIYPKECASVVGYLEKERHNIPYDTVSLLIRRYNGRITDAPDKRKA